DGGGPCPGSGERRGPRAADHARDDARRPRGRERPPLRSRGERPGSRAGGRDRTRPARAHAGERGPLVLGGSRGRGDALLALGEHAQRLGRPLRRVLSWIATFPFLAAFAGLLLVFDPVQRLARLFGRRPQEITAGLLQASLLQALRICGTRFAVERASGVRPDTAYLIIANHQSMFDIVIAGSLLFSNYPKYVAKKEL